MSQSWRAGQTAAGPAHGSNNINQYPGYGSGALSNKVENYTDRDPYGRAGNIGSSNINNMAIGSGRHHPSKLVELINGDSPRTSSKRHREQSASDAQKNAAESSSYGGQHDPMLDGEVVKLEGIQVHIENMEERKERKDRRGQYRLGDHERD